MVNSDPTPQNYVVLLSTDAQAVEPCPSRKLSKVHKGRLSLACASVTENIEGPYRYMKKSWTKLAFEKHAHCRHLAAAPTRGHRTCGRLCTKHKTNF